MDMGKKKASDADSAASRSLADVVPMVRPVQGTRKRTDPATEKQAAAGRANLAKGHAANKAKRMGPRKPGEVTRWEQLLKGQITVADLDEEELKRMHIRNRAGDFAGRQAAIPHKLARDMRTELVRRGEKMLESAYGDAVKLLHDVVKDPNARTGDRVAASKLIIERTAGSVPQHVRLEKGAVWDETFDDVVVIDGSG